MPDNQGGYYSMQCMCGFWSSAHLKPQSQWTDEEIKLEAAHQQFHINQQAYSALNYRSVTENDEKALKQG